MPLYEYVCRECQHRFEEFVLGDSRPRCPSCRSGELQKLLSVFAVSSGAKNVSEAPSACGACGDPRGPGACTN